MTQNYWKKNEKKALKAYRTHVTVFTTAMKNWPERIPETQFLEETEAVFIDLLPALPLQAGSKTHLFNQLMPVLGTIAAAYMVLHKYGYTTAQIGRIEYEGYLLFFKKIPAPVRWMARQFMISWLFPAFMRPAVKAMRASGRSDSFWLEYAYQNKSNPCICMTCTQCGMIAFMEKNKLDDMKKLCNVFDFAQAEAFGLGLKQPSCIGKGDATCRYIFTKDKHDTVLPNNIVAVKNASM